MSAYSDTAEVPDLLTFELGYSSQEKERRLRLTPLQFFLEGVIEQLNARDQGGIFAEPVDTDEVR